MRKETSWQGWRDKNIEPSEYDNEPTSGFVLNKKVGDYDSGWNHRQAYVRIYDPRNFEFEITIENLLFILENTSAIKGKGLEGDFVYGWDGKDLVLIPTESPDYKEIAEYNDIIHNNETIKAKDLIIGATYLTKDNQEKFYIGKFDYFSSGYKWFENGEYKTSKSSRDIPTEEYRYGRRDVDYKYISNYPYGKYFWFAKKYNNSWSFEQYKSISGKFISCTDDKCTQFYADIFELMECSNNYSPYDEVKDKYFDISLDEFIKLGTPYWKEESPCYSSFKFISTKTGSKETYLVDPFRRDINEYKVKKYSRREKDRYTYGYMVGFEDDLSNFTSPTSLELIYETMKPIYKQCYLKNGKEYRKEYTL